MCSLAAATQSPDQLDLPSQAPVDSLAKTLEATLGNHSSFGDAAKTAFPGEAEEETISGVRVGRLVEISDTGDVLVNFPGNPTDSPLAARTTVLVTVSDLRRSVALMFEDASPHKPIIVGLLKEPSAKLIDARAPTEDLWQHDAARGTDSPSFSVEADGQRLVVSADQELVLRCGRSSITLTRSGKILIRGAYLLSRSSGVNRIKGGSVQIN